MMRSGGWLWLSALFIGLFLVPVRLIVMFFPFFNVTEAIVFGGVCFLLALIFKAKSCMWALLVATPVWLFVLLIVIRLGIDRISHGVGTGHALSLVVIPLSAYFGAFLGRKYVQTRLMDSQ